MNLPKYETLIICDASPLILLAKMDDLAGRMVAKRQGIRVMGTLGLLVHAKKNGVIVEIKPFFEKLKIHGWYISEELVQRALQMSGETFL